MAIEPAAHDRVVEALRTGPTSRTKLLKALKDDHGYDRAGANDAIDYVMSLGWAREGDDGIELVNDPANPTTGTA